jgi:hypothetical protein
MIDVNIPASSVISAKDSARYVPDADTAEIHGQYVKRRWRHGHGQPLIQDAISQTGSLLRASAVNTAV